MGGVSQNSRVKKIEKKTTFSHFSPERQIRSHVKLSKKCLTMLSEEQSHQEIELDSEKQGESGGETESLK